MTIRVEYPQGVPEWQRALVAKAVAAIDEYLLTESVEALDEARKCLGVCRIMSALDEPPTSSLPVAGQ